MDQQQCESTKHRVNIQRNTKQTLAKKSFAAVLFQPFAQHAPQVAKSHLKSEQVEENELAEPHTHSHTGIETEWTNGYVI